MTLVVFDFDGTLSDDEMMVLLGEQMEVAEEMARITEQAMNGEIGYPESLRTRVAMLEGLDGEAVAEAFSAVSLRPGMAGLLNDLRPTEVTTAILTAGFTRAVRHVLDQEETEVDVLIANTLEVEDRKLTGEVSGPLVEGTKDIALRALAEDRDISLADVIAVGDGANDLPMLQAAGVAIGYDPKPVVRDACDHTVSSVEELRARLNEHGAL